MSGRAEEALGEFRKAGCPEPDAHLNLAFALGQERKWGEGRIGTAPEDDRSSREDGQRDRTAQTTCGGVAFRAHAVTAAEIVKSRYGR